MPIPLEHARVAFRMPLSGIELAGRSFGGVLWARVECDCRARCCLMDGVDHHLEQGQAFWRNPEAPADHHAVIGSPFSAFSSIARPASSGVIMQVLPCHPRSPIFATATAMPALIFSALKPGGMAGSEKSTVSGFWPTNNIRVKCFLHSLVFRTMVARLR
jgi:hypothetical protein